MQNANVATRKSWIDTLKLFAMFFIYLTHFISSYHSEYYSYWNRMPFSLILNGLTGKLCVAFLGVCLGYFAFCSKEKNATKYILKRYFYFVICGLFINTIRVILRSAGLMKFSYEATGFWNICRDVLYESITLGNGIYVTFWCIFPFFVSSVLAYMNGRAGVKAIGIIVQMICFWMIKQTWISICLLGALVAVLKEKDIVRKAGSKWWVRLLVVIGIFFVVKRKESNITYLIDGICSGLLLLVIEYSPPIQQLLNRKFLAKQGETTMAIFLLHTVVYAIVGKYLFALMESFPYKIAFILTLIGCWTITVLISIPVTKLLNRILKLFSNVLNRAGIGKNGKEMTINASEAK